MKPTIIVCVLVVTLWLTLTSHTSVRAQPSSVSSPLPIATRTANGQPADPKSREFVIRVFGRTLRLKISVGTLGLAVIVTLFVLLILSLVLGTVARRRSKQMVVANRKLQDEIAQRIKAEDAVKTLNAELETRVRQRTAQLQAANDELESFSYSVSHDLRAPLRHIDGFSQALTEDYSDRLDRDGSLYLTEIRSATQEMAQLIDDMLLLSRVARSEMHRELVDLSQMANEIMANLKVSDPGRNSIVEIEKGLSAWGDRRLLQIMLSNLLGNAWKFTSKQEKAVISFRRETRGDETAFVVRDNGAGFDMNYSDKLFRAFQRLHRAAEFEGTGIGLATVQRVALRHGGRVWAEGEVGIGATFYFTVMDSAVNSLESQSQSAA